MDDLFDRAEVGALLEALADDASDVRIAGMEALTRLPLGSSVWQEVAAQLARMLEPSAPPSERAAAMGAVARMPPSVVDGPGAALTEVVESVHEAGPPIRPEHQLLPGWTIGAPPGFAVLSGGALGGALDLLAEPPFAAIWRPAGPDQAEPDPAVSEEFRQGLVTMVPLALAPAVVTVLLEEARRTGAAWMGDRVVQWVSGLQGRFVPDVDGLFEVYRRQAFRERDVPSTDTVRSWVERFLAQDVETPWRALSRQIAWVVSRGGIQGLVPALAHRLGSTDRDERTAAACLVADAAILVTQAHPPLSRPPPGEGSAPRSVSLDDDVQFSVYRPARVRPGNWYALLAFAHRGSPVQDPDGSIVDPVKLVERQARALLEEEPGAFGLIRSDSDFPLLGGTDLLFEPWLEEGQFNPATASLQWQEPVHRVSFRFRVASSADGRRLAGGVRVFAGGLMIGEVRFHVSATVDAPVTVTPVATPVTRYRNIFASYSHADADVVKAVADYVAVTGDRYLVDAQSLRSGERWSEGLTRLIEQADVFQLFWSRNAMRSAFVRQEWEYALALARDGFIRPVYWEEPFPTDPGLSLPPPSLRQLHFSKLATAPAARHPVGVSPVGNEQDARSGAESTPAPASIVCRSCGFRNSAEVDFCASCGRFQEWAGEKIGQPDSTGEAPPTLPAATDPVVPAAPEMGAPRLPPQVARGVPSPTAKSRPAPVQPGDVRCDRCGQGNSRGRRFCSRCGTSLATGPVAQVPPAGSHQRGRPVVARKVILLVTLVALVALGVVLAGLQR